MVLMTGRWPLTGRAEELETISAAMRRGHGGGVVLAGSPGVGKTRLADELLTISERRQKTRRVVATESARSLPLGAFAEWLPAGPFDSMHAARAVIEVLAGQDAARPVVVGVDDAHLLDDLSAFVVHQLVSRRLATVVLTIRSGKPAPDAISALWKDGYLDRFDVQPLSRVETVRLLESVLGGALDPVAAQQMWQITRGNALYLRHLVDQEIDGRHLHLTSGGWSWEAGIAVATSVSDLIVSEMGTLPPEMVDLIDIMAVAEPLNIALLTCLVDPEIVEQAEVRGLVITERGFSGDAVRLSHPMYGEVRRARAGTLRLRRIRGRVAELLESSEGGGCEDVLRFALLMLESDRKPDPARSLEAATEAILLSDYHLAERLSRSAGPGYDAKMVHLLALMQLWRAEDVENEIVHFESSELSDDQRVHIAVLRALNLLLMLGRPAKALEVLDGATVQGNSAEAEGALTAVHALLHASQARPGEAIETSTVALALPQPFASNGIVALCGLLTGLGDRGRMSEMRSAAMRGYEIGQHYWLAASLRFYLADLHIRYLLYAGYSAEVDEVINRISGQFVDVPGNVQVWAATYRAHAALGTGRLDSARRLFGQVLAGRSASGGWEYRYRHELAQTLAMLGVSSDAMGMLRSCTDEFPQSSVVVEPQFLLAEAWVAASAGTVTEAIGIARSAGELARTRTQFAPEVVCLQTVTQFGDGTTCERLAELATLVEGPRAPIAAAYATALAANNGEALNAVSVRFEEMGDRVAAADAVAQAAAVFARGRRRGSATICLERARRLASECGGASTPALRQAGAPPNLTSRQREIIHLANEGFTNKQIADHVHLSVRTVEGHLYRAGIKTGVRSRDELGRTLRGD